MISNEIRYLIYLLHCAFNEIKPEKQEGINYKTLIALSQRHQIYTIIIPLISDFDDIPQEILQEMNNYRLSEITKMIAINNDRNIILSELEKNGIRYMPLKGLQLKKYYPLESMRQMSDNDILIERENRSTVMSLMKSFGFSIQETLGNSDDYYKKPYSTFEFHFELFFNQLDFCPVFENLWDNASPDKDNKYLYYMDINDLYLHSVSHMYKHYITAGCGIRFLADIYLFLRKEEDKLDKIKINEFLEKYNILEFERMSKELAFRLFDNKELDENDEKMLETFINSGIFGTQSNKLKNEFKKYDDALSLKEKKRKYLIQRLFPKKEEMLLYHGILKDKPYLLPWYYIKRFFNAIFKFREFKSEYDSVRKLK